MGAERVACDLLENDGGFDCLGKQEQNELAELVCDTTV